MVRDMLQVNNWRCCMVTLYDPRTYGIILNVGF